MAMSDCECCWETPCACGDDDWDSIGEVFATGSSSEEEVNDGKNKSK